jgi:hypothetical protein
LLKIIKSFDISFFTGCNNFMYPYKSGNDKKEKRGIIENMGSVP